MRILMLILVGFACSFIVQAQPAGPDITGVVAAYDAYQAKPNRKARRTLMQALSDYSDAPTTETVNAHMAVLNADTKAGKAKDMRESASAMAEHLQPVADILPQQYTEARYIAAISLFNWKQDDDAMIEMAHAQGLAQQARRDPEAVWARSLRYNADAWRMAMGAYFASADKRYPSDAKIDAVLAEYSADADSINAFADSAEDAGDELRFCSGKLEQKPAMRYPAGGARKGMFGALILKLAFDDEGNVQNPEVLASVPLEGFGEKSLRTVRKWHYEAAEGEQPGETCRLYREDVVLPIVFQLN